MRTFGRFVAITAMMTVISGTAIAQTTTIKSGNVIGSPLPGEMAHHMQQTQHDFARLVSVETNGAVTFEILEGKRADIPVFRMPGMVQDGSVIQATAVPSFFLPQVPELNIFEIPYLFRDIEHVRRYPTSDVAAQFANLIEDRYGLKVLGHFLVAHHVAITSTDKPIILPDDFAGRFVNDDFESFAPMWSDIKPAKRYSIGYTEAVAGALHTNTQLDTSIGMLQNIYIQKQYTKFRYATLAPSFYTFFYTLLINQDSWDALTESQQNGVLRAANATQELAFSNEQATTIYHTALNQSLRIRIHEQTIDERAAWAKEFSPKVRDGILERSQDPDSLTQLIEGIRAL